MTRTARKIRQAISEADMDWWAVMNAGNAMHPVFSARQKDKLLAGLVRHQKAIWGTPWQRRFWNYSPLRLRAYRRTLAGFVTAYRINNWKESNEPWHLP